MSWQTRSKAFEKSIYKYYIDLATPIQDLELVMMYQKQLSSARTTSEESMMRIVSKIDSLVIID